MNSNLYSVNIKGQTQKRLGYKIFFLLYVALVLMGCKHQAIKPVRLAKNVTIYPAPPEILKENYSAHHSLTLTYKQKVFQMQAQIEKSNNELTIVGLNSTLVNIFQIYQTNNHYVYTQFVKTPIKPKYILGLYYLIFSDAETLKTIVSGNIQIKEIKIAEITTRSIFSNSKEYIKITYQSFKNGTKINLQYNDRPINITITVDYQTPL